MRTDPEIEYLFQPDQDCRRFGNRVKVNRYSMRSDDFPARKSDPRELRVMVIGDSVVNGGALTDQSDLGTTLMQRTLAEALGRPVVVGNISAGSWGTPNQAAFVRRFGLFDADVIVIVLSSHDVADVPHFDPKETTGPAFPTHRPPLALWEGFTRYVLSRATAEPPPPPPVEGPQLRADTEASMAALRQMFDAARAANAKVLVALHLARDESLAAPDPGHHVITQEANRAGVPVVPLGPAFRAAREPLYRDQIHPNAAGQRVIGQTLAAAVQALLQTPARTTAPATTPPVPVP
jgi:lysophospholipase L1-like esterase